MTINGIKVESIEHLEILIADMDELSKEGQRALYLQEQLEQ